MNLLEEFLSQLGIFSSDVDDIAHTSDSSEFVVVDNEEVSAIINSGADINYANKEWCL